MYKRIAVFAVIVLMLLTLMFGVPLVIAYLTSSIEASLTWMGRIGGLVLLALGVIGPSHLRQWVGVSLGPKAPYELRRQEIVDRGARLNAILMGLSSIINFGLRDYVPLDVRTPLGFGLILVGLLCVTGFGIASLLLVPAPPRAYVAPRRDIPHRIQPMPVVEDDSLDPEAQEILDDLRRLWREIIEDM